LPSAHQQISPDHIKIIEPFEDGKYGAQTGQDALNDEVRVFPGPH